MWRGPPASITTEFRYRSGSLHIIMSKLNEAGKQTDGKKPLWRSKVFLLEDSSVLKVQRRSGAVHCSGLTQSGF